MGDQFDPNTCGVNLFFDSSQGATLGFSSASAGEFAADVAIPAGAQAGDHVVVAVGLVPVAGDCTGPSGQEARATFTVGAVSTGPFVGAPVTPFVQVIDVRTLPIVKPWAPGDPVRIGPGQELPGEISSGEKAGAVAATPNVIAGRRRGSASVRPRLKRVHRLKPGVVSPATSLLASFDGAPATGVLPPDVDGDVGPNHYIQVVNSAFTILDKQGNVLAGPSNINGLFTGAGGPCETNNDGDPDVRYDPLADRWVIHQFVAFTDFCVAVSRTADPVAGGWFLYDFPTSGVSNDYPKLGVWPDAYYAGSQRGYPGSGSDAWAFDRALMLGGSPATSVRFFDSGTFMLPSDLDGATPPPAGAPNVFLRPVDGAQFGGVDRLELREFHVDFAVPANSTFTALPDIPTAAFDRNVCGLGLFGVCIAQPGTSQLLSSFTAWPLARLQYRNFGTHESLVFDHDVDADGADHAGVRWYELRKAGAWSIFQQGTHAPDLGAPGLADDVHRWLASAAMDKNGNLAVGYSVSSATVFPGLSYSGRFPADPAGTLPQGETSIVAGAGSQTNASGRWGDYSSMTVDPVDDCTFWFSSEYYAATSDAGWRTRIASFRLDGAAPAVTCPAAVTVECSATGGTPAGDPQLAGFLAGASATDDCASTPVVTNNAPPVFPLGVTTVTFTATDGSGNSGTCSSTVTVHDTVAPSIVAPPPVTAECTSPAGAMPPLGTPVVADVCDPSPIVSNDAPTSFPVGTTTVTWTATDHSANAGTD
ncbi:MAG TPA: HYR domain-containing protein, partial [Verrucomicrobiae bacterium]|nr:HYR domain-containing protein [Verrucomicrobiae bacterium]